MDNFSRVLLPKITCQNIDEFEKSGFVFKDYNDKLMYIENMPDGWSIVNRNNQVIIIDHLNRTRAICENKELILLPMYQVYTISNMDNTVYEVFFGNDTQKIKCFGEVTISKNASLEEITAMRIVLDKLVQNAISFANEFYPMWQDVLAYWDTDEYFQTKKTGK